MIRKIINDLACDTITLAKALTMSKIVASDIKNDTFKQWIKSELEGYTCDRSQLPEYRILPCELVAKEFYLNSYHERPVDARAFDKKLQQECGFSIYKIYVTQSVSTIEQMLTDKNDGNICMSLPPFIVNSFRESCFDGQDTYDIQQTAHLSRAQNILVQVKNKLLDTLLELSEQFPDFKSDIFKDPMNKEKANSIVTFNIYGGNPNINSSTGDNNTLNISTNEIADKFCNQLKELGVSEKDAEDARQIVLSKQEPGFKDRLMNWVGSMANTAVKEGIKIEVGKLIALAGGLI